MKKRLFGIKKDDTLLKTFFKNDWSHAILVNKD